MPPLDDRGELPNSLRKVGQRVVEDGLRCTDDGLRVADDGVRWIDPVDRPLSREMEGERLVPPCEYEGYRLEALPREDDGLL